MKHMIHQVVILALAVIFLTGTAFSEATDTDALLGVLNGETYENEFLGLGCTLEGWHYYSEEEIMEVNKLALSIVTDDLRKMIESAQNITIMGAESSTGLANVNIQIQDIKQYKAVYELMGIESVIGSGLDMIRESYESMGCEVDRLEITKTMIGDQEYSSLDMSYKMNGISAYQKQVYYIRDNYMVYVTVVSFITDSTEEILSLFYQC